MNEERLGSTAAFAEELSLHLPELAAAELPALIELAFFASLHEEEARRNAVAIAWTSGARDCAAAVALRTPVLATPKNVAKLAPAAARGAALAVRRQDGQLVIWALLEHGRGARPLTIHLIAAGVLRVDYHDVPRALYARGETIFLGEVKSPARRLSAAFSSWAGSEIDPRAATVTRIAARALAHGHGGMILILPAGAEPVGVRMHYEVAHGADLLASRYAGVMVGAPPGERLDRIDALVPALDFVASLTATDNALLVDTDLCVRAFGVQVIEGEAPHQSFEHVSPYRDDQHTDDISTFKGTRHPAGVIFCLRQPGEAAAIIASQDGRLSLVVKDAHGVVEVLGSYERAFGWR